MQEPPSSPAGPRNSSTPPAKQPIIFPTSPFSTPPKLKPVEQVMNDNVGTDVGL